MQVKCLDQFWASQDCGSITNGGLEAGGLRGCGGPAPSRRRRRGGPSAGACVGPAVGVLTCCRTISPGAPGGGKPSPRARPASLPLLRAALSAGCGHSAASSYLRGVAAESPFNCDVLLISF